MQMREDAAPVAAEGKPAMEQEETATRRPSGTSRAAGAMDGFRNTGDADKRDSAAARQHGLPAAERAVSESPGGC